MSWTTHIVAVLTKRGADYERLKSIIKEANAWAKKEHKTKLKLWTR